MTGHSERHAHQGGWQEEESVVVRAGAKRNPSQGDEREGTDNRLLTPLPLECRLPLAQPTDGDPPQDHQEEKWRRAEEGPLQDERRNGKGNGPGHREGEGPPVLRSGRPHRGPPHRSEDRRPSE